MIVAIYNQHPAVAVRARVVAVLEGVHAAVDARSLAVPDREHAVDLRVRDKIELLCASDRGRSEVFVDTGLETNVVPVEQITCLPQGGVQSAERRPSISRNEARGVEAVATIRLALQEQQAHERLVAVDHDLVVSNRVLRVQGNIAQWLATFMPHDYACRFSQ